LDHNFGVALIFFFSFLHWFTPRPIQVLLLELLLNPGEKELKQELRQKLAGAVNMIGTLSFFIVFTAYSVVCSGPLSRRITDLCCHPGLN
jgi:hypothetical protein